MDSRFPFSDRSDPERLRAEVRMASGHPVMEHFYCAARDLMAVLNEHGQIVAVNDLFPSALGVKDPDSIFGMRPGEAVNCIHAEEAEAGCGAGPHCRTCGAAIAIASAFADSGQAEETCTITSSIEGALVDSVYAVRACPIVIQGNSFVMLFLRDITEDELRAALESAFFHDMNNIINGLNLASEVLQMDETRGDDPVVEQIGLLAAQLNSEMQAQRLLAAPRKKNYVPPFSDVSIDELIHKVRSMLALHSAALGKALDIEDSLQGATIHTAPYVVNRILMNMLINAFEATGDGGRVVLRVYAEAEGDDIVFAVWNAGAISDDYAQRVFQYQFSSKSGRGRGLGTYSMKRLGEGVLGGRVSFSSSAGGGTEFFLKLPRGGAAGRQ